MRHRPAQRRRRPPGSSACLCSGRKMVSDTVSRPRPRQAPLMRLVSLQRIQAALRCPGMPIFPDDPASVLRMAEAVGPALFSRGRIPAFLSAHSCGFSPGEAGSDVCSVIFRLFAARRGAFAGASLSARRSSPRAAGSRRLAGCCSRQRSWDSTLRSFAPAGQFRNVFGWGGPPDVCLSHPPRCF